MRDIKKYDKYLYLDKKLDGTRVIKRQSPFKVTRNFDILTIRNQYMGSGQWLFSELQKMDNQRVNIIGRVAENNKRLYRERKLTDRRIHTDMASYLTRSII